MIYSIGSYRVLVAAVLVAMAAVACKGGNKSDVAAGGSPAAAAPGTAAGDASCGLFVPPVGTKYGYSVDIFNSAGEKTGFDTFFNAEVLPAITFNGKDAFPLFAELTTTPVTGTLAGTPKAPVDTTIYANTDGTNAFLFGSERTSTIADGTKIITLKVIQRLSPTQKRSLNPTQDTVTNQTLTQTITASGGGGSVAKVVAIKETFLGKEDITVPAGEFSDVCKFETTTSIEGKPSSTITTWTLPNKPLDVVI